MEEGEGRSRLISHSCLRGSQLSFVKEEGERIYYCVELKGGERKGGRERKRERKGKERKKRGKKKAPFFPPPDLEQFYNLVLLPRWTVGTGFAPTATASHHVWLPRKKEHPQDNREWLNLFSDPPFPHPLFL